MANNLEKVKIGLYKGDPSGDSAREFVQKFNNNMDKVFVGENVVSSGKDPSTGLGWDPNTQTIFIDLQQDHLTYGTSDGVVSLSVSEVIKRGLSSFGIAAENLVQAVTDLSQHMVYRKTLLDVKKSFDHTYYSVMYIENRANILPIGLPPIYVWMPDSEEEDDDTSIIKPDDILSSEPGRWVLFQRVSLSDPVWWVSSDDDNDLKDLETALNQAEPGTTIVLFPGVYNISSTLVVPENIYLKAYNAYNSYSDSTNDGINQVVLRGTTANLTLLQCNPNISIDGIRFEGQGDSAYLLEFIERGMALGEDDSEVLEQLNNDKSYIRNCSFAPVDQNKTINAIKATVSGDNNRLRPIYLPTSTVSVENCYITTYGGVGLQVEKFVWVKVSYTEFNYNEAAVRSQLNGLCRLDRCFINYGNKGLVSSTSYSRRCVAEVMSDASQGEREVVIRYKWSESQDPTFPFNPKSFLYLELLGDGDDFVSLIISTEERIDNDPISYRVTLQEELNQDLTSGDHFLVLQGSVIEASACISYYVGAGNDPNDYSGIHQPDNITEESGTGLAIWS